MTRAIMLASILLVGCNNLSPRDNLSPQIKQELDNNRARINGIENNQNAIKVELGRISNELGIHDSNIQDMQQGWLNVQGIHILQGDGPLFLIFATVVIGMLLYYMYQSEKYHRTAKFFARHIKKDAMLQEQVLKAAWRTDLEKLVFNMAKDI